MIIIQYRLGSIGHIEALLVYLSALPLAICKKKKRNHSTIYASSDHSNTNVVFDAIFFFTVDEAILISANRT